MFYFENLPDFLFTVFFVRLPVQVRYVQLNMASFKDSRVEKRNA